MNRFEFARPGSVADAVGLLSDKAGECEPLAGGTDLLSLMKDFVVEPRRLVSLMGIGTMKGVQAAGSGLTIGATTTIDELLASEALKKSFPALLQAALGIKSPQLRAMGTVGGELLQRPRCWYFRHGHGLLAQLDGKSLVEAGDHRYHAVFGNSGPAKFVHASSLAPALIALDASVQVEGPKGSRKIALADLYRTPAKEGDRETTLAANEIVTQVLLPAPGAQSATYEVRPRQGLDWPLATASVSLVLDGKKVTAARIVLGHVAPTPWRAEAAAKGLVGQTLDEKSITAAAAAAVTGASPLKNNAYKVELARVATQRALRAAAAV